MGPWVDHYWRLVVTIWLIVFTVVVFLGIHSVLQNQRDIQRNRIESCRRTYLSFPLVFAPFFPPETDRTTIQKKNFAKLSKVSLHLADQCTAQTTP
jgi:hypothetical protein